MKGESLVCFCVLNPGFQASRALAEALKELVGERLGKPLRPAEVRFVGDRPKTRNARVMRRVVRAAYLKLELGDLSALENLSSVKEIRRAN